MPEIGERISLEYARDRTVITLAYFNSSCKPSIYLNLTQMESLNSTKRVYLKGRQVSVVGSHSGQSNSWRLKILWSDKLGFSYYKSFHNHIDEPSSHEEACKIAKYIESKGYIHPDKLDPDGKKIWSKDFYPHKHYQVTYAD